MAKNGLHLINPTSIAYTGTSASISANGSVTFSACSELSLNGVFSADYDNYMIVAWHLATGNGYGLRARWRSGGVDESSASNYYTRQNLDADGASVTGARATINYHVFGPADDDRRSGTTAFVYGPYLTQPTAFRSVTVSGYSNAWLSDYASTHSLSASYDGLTLYTFTGTVDGRVAVYGMRK